MRLVVLLDWVNTKPFLTSVELQLCGCRILTGLSPRSVIAVVRLGKSVVPNIVNLLCKDGNRKAAPIELREFEPELADFSDEFLFFLHDERVISMGLKHCTEAAESRIVYSEIKQGTSYNKRYVSGSHKEVPE